MTGSITAHRILEDCWSTPGGHPCTFAYREGTNDWNTLTASLDQDEYDLPKVSGHALDIGGYLGSVGIALALDNPDAWVTIVEPVPENCDLIERNIALNEVADRVELIEGAVGGGSVKYGYSGTDALDHHTFVGNSTLFVDATGDYASVDYEPLTLADLLPADFLKIDTEGAEWLFLDSPRIGEVPLIAGEWHPTDGHTMYDLLALLVQTHHVTFSGPEAGPGGFRAVRL